MNGGSVSKRKRARRNLRRFEWCRHRLLCVGSRCRFVAAGLIRRLEPRPTVIIDARRRQAKQLRKSISRAARTYARALGVELPENLVVIAQHVVVHELAQLNGLCQAFQGQDGARRHVVLLAFSVNGHSVSDDELLAALRCGLTHALEDAIGKPILSAPIDLEVPRARIGAPIAEFRSNGQRPPAEPERGGIPIQRVENKQAS
jgi:hypothetical protein